MAAKNTNKSKIGYAFNISRCFSVIFIFLILIKISGSTICQNTSSVSTNSTLYNYTCPGTGEPRSYTECCISAGCCPRQRYFYEIDKALAGIIAVSVVSVCIVLTILVTVCCFWSRCPLYSSCRVEFAHDVATYVSKDDSLDLGVMPTEFSAKANNKFSPVVVSNGNLPLDVDNNSM